jgi:hypothetical protein
VELQDSHYWTHYLFLLDIPASMMTVTVFSPVAPVCESSRPGEVNTQKIPPKEIEHVRHTTTGACLHSQAL